MYLLLLYVLLQVFKLTSSSASSKICYGGKVENLPMGCETVIGYPLVVEGFENELTLDTEAGKILLSIKRVTNGIIIRKNIFKHFNVMGDLQYLAVYPDNGPVLRIENNPNLVSLQFNNLRIIQGSMPLVGFWNDNFPVQMRKDEKAYTQFLNIIGAAGHNIDPCHSNYFDLYVKEEESSSSHWQYLIAGSLGALALVIVIDIVWFAAFQYWWERKLIKLEFEREKCARGKNVKQWEKTEKWRLECLKIANEEKKFMDGILKDTKEDPYYAPGELEKWAEQRKNEMKQKRKKKQTEKGTVSVGKEDQEGKEEEKKVETKLEQNKGSAKKTKSKSDYKKQQTVKKNKKGKSTKEQKMSVKKLRIQETKNNETVGKVEPIGEYLDQTQADDMSLSLQPTLKTMKLDASSNFDEPNSSKKATEF